MLARELGWSQRALAVCATLLLVVTTVPCVVSSAVKSLATVSTHGRKLHQASVLPSSTHYECFTSSRDFRDLVINWDYNIPAATWACRKWNCGNEECQASAMSSWVCRKPDNSPVAWVSIWWGHDLPAASWACNSWRSGQCGGQCTALPATTDGRKVFLGWLGSWSGGIAPPALTDLPAPSTGVDFYVALSFAREQDGANNCAQQPCRITANDGNFNFYSGIRSDSKFSTDAIAEAKGRGIKFMASLAGGDGYNPWFNTAGTGWINTARNSLLSLVNTYNLDGIDVNYEEFPNGNSNFANYMCQVLTWLKQQKPNLKVSISPFADATVDGAYQAMWKQCQFTGIDWVNYQTYAESTPPIDVIKRNLWKYLYGTPLVAGFCTTAAPNNRGVDYNGAGAVISEFNANGKHALKGVALWSLEDTWRASGQNTGTFQTTLNNWMNRL